MTLPLFEIFLFPKRFSKFVGVKAINLRTTMEVMKCCPHQGDEIGKSPFSKNKKSNYIDGNSFDRFSSSIDLKDAKHLFV